MAKVYLQKSNLAELESLRTSFNSNLNLQTFNSDLKADLQLEFEAWLNDWTTKAYREGVTAATI
ncbi:hypothetical protein [Chamaesiphon minutus]|uniref:Uncharacterized protein n=1 Tax=Chamaesiphon minutus (strain ATCC 27169 / PCC 6605) TaxID=1173020 RepID=K9UIY8_CHAP6|nr:hypothetical protein [Chamaesiphon minutus]AFY94628.1 hypothetical protein Cha6605_3646 [Chamaesiphon minutus PCC 6605]